MAYSTIIALSSAFVGGMLLNEVTKIDQRAEIKKENRDIKRMAKDISQSYESELKTKQAIVASQKQEIDELYAKTRKKP